MRVLWSEFLREAGVQNLEKVKIKTQKRRYREGYQRYAVQEHEFEACEEEQAWSVCWRKAEKHCHFPSALINKFL